MKVSVVVTSYNTSALARRCVDGVLAHKGAHDVQIVVVDDASTDPVRPHLPPEVEVVVNPTNQGYVRSVNIGVARARGELVFLLDSDAAPLSDIFTPAIAAFESQPKLGAVGYHLVDEADRPTGNAQPEPTALGLALGQALEARFIAVAPARFGGDGGPITIHSCAITFRRAAFEQIGGFDEGFDFLDADTDFSMRLRRAGWDLAMLDAKVLHAGSGSPQTTAKRVVRFHVNRLRLLEKHGLISHPLLLKGVLAARHAAELAIVGGLWTAIGRDPSQRADRLASRKQLLATVWRSYRAA
ncbi:MAG TPA: glycosyltransferase [Polyangia bacterium]|nr:glycosyltransferase [Polyangia bacterium]